MNSLLAGALGTALPLVFLLAGSPVLAQDSSITITADGSTSSDANNDGGQIILGDISSLPPGTVIDISNSPGTQPGGSAAAIGGESAPPPGRSRGAAEAPPAPAPTEGDLDADNYPDDLETQAGLDPTNPDTDGDGVADGDEGAVYGTDAFVYDTDGDGYGDGEELLWNGTDPLDPGSGAETAAIGGMDSGGGAENDPCAGFADWYEAQNAYESAGGIDSGETRVSALDPDRDGIACESIME